MTFLALRAGMDVLWDMLGAAAVAGECVSGSECDAGILSGARVDAGCVECSGADGSWDADVNGVFTEELFFRILLFASSTHVTRIAQNVRIRRLVR